MQTAIRLTLHQPVCLGPEEIGGGGMAIYEAMQMWADRLSAWL
ncbi:hypothetical protein NOV72_01424 [Caballeronia novacaledonica]|uniref:Uncharacterized protein n=1 Tax=Caballeronia novacaledonica TaxID=1544861 RepID=A0A2U3I226_9BURK|nr:hypothetical protein NOV72_01424 [Caballeronia novacaledonica]